MSAHAEEHTRLIAEVATKTWLLRILPIGIVVILVVMYLIQRTLNVPLFKVIGLSDCKHINDEDAHKKCVENNDTFSDGQMNTARIVVACIFIGVIYFVYDVFKDGFGAGLIGPSSQFSPTVTDPTEMIKMQIDKSQMDLEKVTRDVSKGIMDQPTQLPQEIVKQVVSAPTQPPTTVQSFPSTAKVEFSPLTSSPAPEPSSNTTSLSGEYLKSQLKSPF